MWYCSLDLPLVIPRCPALDGLGAAETFSDSYRNATLRDCRSALLRAVGSAPNSKLHLNWGFDASLGSVSDGER